MRNPIGLQRLFLPLLALVVACGVAGSVAFARSSAAPQNTAVPQISGTAKEGSTLTASDGTWTGSPTSFTYQWRRCASDGTACGSIVGATNKSYTVASADVGHTL